uniref:Reverse transcriptase Ty1/copia-type domain-containing protein n=1 Tax=Solanum lycopersicum TaxID=4081 RepID=A0A3Q7EXD1_SOLLC
SALSNRFSLKDLGPLHFFLGIKVLPQSAGLFLSQTKCIMDILQEFSMLNDGSPPRDAKKYRSAIGKLQYLAFTRPDISFSPSHTHWQVVKCLIRYLKSNIHYGLLFHHRSNTALHVYIDAEWVGDHDDRTSTWLNTNQLVIKETKNSCPIFK